MATIVSDDHSAPTLGNLWNAPLGRFERWALAGLIVLMLSYGVLVVIRSAFVDRPYTDLGVFLHAAWAVRTDNDIYAITFNGWLYCYPPLLAILMVPLALPPEGCDTAWTLPLSITSAIWYLLNLGFVMWGVHRLAVALEEKSAMRVLVGSRQWWALRTLPIVATLIAIGSAQGHGQTNLLLLALLCAMTAAWLRGQGFQAGLWLAGAICIKIIPAYLLLYPLWRRDARSLAGCTTGLVIGLIAIPTLVFGPERMWDYNCKFVAAVILPSLHEDDYSRTDVDRSRDETLTNITATDTQSFMAIMHNTMYLDRRTRPDQVSPIVKGVHLAIAGALTLLTLYAGGWRRPESAAKETIFVGMLIVIMMLTSPVCHLHYFPWLIPLLMGLIQWQWRNGASDHISVPWVALLAGNNAIHIMAHLREYDAMVVIRDLCICSYVALAVWLVGWLSLARRTP